MWWQYLIVTIVVGGCVIYLLRGLVGVLLGKKSSTCGGCQCGNKQEPANPRLGKKKELFQLGVDRQGDETGA